MTTKAARAKRRLDKLEEVKALLTDGVPSEHPTEEQNVVVVRTRPTVAWQRMRVVGVPVDRRYVKRDFLHKAIHGEPASLDE